ncbi:MAG: hypothetical protein KZQ90_19645 [Candidatus Thiodiazotropha sp. (ex Codakia rugifera)]|nr:hypothetical protein [Candidatus Thiodiazotropha sp. (ex Codakia rugifera)]
MFTPKLIAVVLILSCIVAFASWSKLRFVDEQDHEVKRWRIDEYPGFKEKNHQNKETAISNR